MASSGRDRKTYQISVHDYWDLLIFKLIFLANYTVFRSYTLVLVLVKTEPIFF